MNFGKDEIKKEFKRPAESRERDMRQGKMKDSPEGFFKEGSDNRLIDMPKSSNIKEIICRAKDKRQRMRLNLGARQGFKLPIPLMSMQNGSKLGSNEGNHSTQRQEEEKRNLFDSRVRLNQTSVDIPKKVATVPLNSNFLRFGKRRGNFFGRAQPIIDPESVCQGKLEDRGVSSELDDQESRLEPNIDSFANHENELSPIEGPSHDIK